MEETGCEKGLGEFLFVGSPLLDMTAHCSPETLDRYGLKSDDCIRETDQQETLFHSLANDPDSQMCAGGSSQNTARIAKWILGDTGRVAFAGCVGKDSYASTMLECVQSEGVEALYLPLSNESTGVCACLLSSEGDRSMIARLGAAEHFAEYHLHEKRVFERFRRANCIFVEGYFFGHSPDVMLALAETCSDHQVLSVSLSAEYICREYADILARVLPRVDILFSNEAEAKVLAKSWNFKGQAVEDIARMLAGKDKPRTVIITRGPNPLLVAQGTDPVRSFPIPSGVKVVDGVGCGDAVAGAFLAMYHLTGDVDVAAKTGISAAVEIAQVRGCRPTQKKLYPPEDRR